MRLMQRKVVAVPTGGRYSSGHSTRLTDLSLTARTGWGELHTRGDSGRSRVGYGVDSRPMFY